MKAFGSIKRTYHNCRVYRVGDNKKILFTVGIKNRKSARSFSKEEQRQVNLMILENNKD
jgi:hypothetical protein